LSLKGLHAQQAYEVLPLSRTREVSSCSKVGLDLIQTNPCLKVLNFSVCLLWDLEAGGEMYAAPRHRFVDLNPGKLTVLSVTFQGKVKRGVGC
jgi:hypothetical protein